MDEEKIDIPEFNLVGVVRGELLDGTRERSGDRSVIPRQDLGR
jgi:hypothetical protein